MFAAQYHERHQKLIKEIIAFYGFKFFYFKKVLDLGCGYADISGSLHRLGAEVTALDARDSHLKAVNKKFQNIKTIHHDLDRGWIFNKNQFDMILDLGLICHLNNYEEHLRSVCDSTTHLILETSVSDSDDANKNIIVQENKNIYDLSVNGNGSRPSSAAIERILTERGMTFKRVDDPKFNTNNYIYNWESKNNNDTNLNNRRIWFCIKSSSPIKFAKPCVVSEGMVVHPLLQIILPEPDSIPKAIVTYNIPVNVVNNNLKENKFVIVMPSYNNEKWCEQNILSAINQNYNNYRIIFTDDCSKDHTFNIVKNIIDNSSKKNKITLIKNNVRAGALENLYNMINSCEDEEIILTVDGDDWLADNDVLNKLNYYYSSNDIWITYGQYSNSTDGGIGVASQYAQNVINSNTFRQVPWGASHLRTFYSWLFKKINKQDLFYNGKFMSMTWDLLTMFPMLEMAGQHSKYISDRLYIYNMSNPISDHCVDQKLQAELDSYVRKMPKYTPISKPIFRPQNAGLMLISTGKYDVFVQNIINSADKHFLNRSNVTYYIFTDSKLKFNSSRNIITIPIKHEKFPYATLNRFKHFTNNAFILSKEDYLFYSDVDALFVDDILEQDLLGSLIGTQHCGFVDLNGPVENNPNSCLYLDQAKYKRYYGGGFSGGRTSEYFKLAKWCYDAIERDLSNGIMPLHHDETAINSYFAINEPSIVLDSGYHYPESNHDHYKSIWKGKVFKPKIILLDKDHAKIRE